MLGGRFSRKEDPSDLMRQSSGRGILHGRPLASEGG